MNKGIIQTAVTNKSLRLELEYQEPSLLAQSDGMECLTIDTELELLFEHPYASDEFTCCPA